MRRLLLFTDAVDRLTESIGQWLKWLVLLSSLVSAGNALMRYSIHYSSNAWLEIQWYMFGAMFLLGAGYRLKDWLTLGLAGFPVASGGAEYHYDIGGTAVLDKTEIVFFETTPMLSLNVPNDRLLPGKLAFGAGYRISYVTFDREKGDAKDPRVLNLKLSGLDATGFRHDAIRNWPISPAFFWNASRLARCVLLRLNCSSAARACRPVAGGAYPWLRLRVRSSRKGVAPPARRSVGATAPVPTSRGR